MSIHLPISWTTDTSWPNWVELVWVHLFLSKCLTSKNSWNFYWKMFTLPKIHCITPTHGSNWPTVRLIAHRVIVTLSTYVTNLCSIQHLELKVQCPENLWESIYKICVYIEMLGLQRFTRLGPSPGCHNNLIEQCHSKTGLYHFLCRCDKITLDGFGDPREHFVQNATL